MEIMFFKKVVEDMIFGCVCMCKGRCVSFAVQNLNEQGDCASDQKAERCAHTLLGENALEISLERASQLHCSVCTNLASRLCLLRTFSNEHNANAQ